MMNLNLKTAFLISKHVVSQMEKQGHGKVVHVPHQKFPRLFFSYHLRNQTQLMVLAFQYMEQSNGMKLGISLKTIFT